MVTVCSKAGVEAPTCFEAKDEIAACSSARIKDDRL
jgi:hypothetical protein